MNNRGHLFSKGDWVNDITIPQTFQTKNFVLFSLGSCVD